MDNLKRQEIKNIGQKPSHEAVFMGVSKKAEKIGAAIYMVTDLIEFSDPIRHRIRQRSIDLISETRSMSYSFSGDVHFVIARCIGTAWEIVSLIEVASSVGFISDMNSKILKGVLVELIASLRDKQRREGFSQIEDLKIGESLSDQISLSKTLFDVSEDVFEKTKSVSAPIFSDKKTEVFSPKISPSEKVLNDKEPEKNKTENNPKKESAVKSKPSDRRPKILEIIKEKGEVNVHDITASFPDVSSKTIQRELNSLVEENVLKRVGEKRWSKYSFI
ncbi:MAG: DeoR family transcriptional regulator [Candidatus Paceibacterota bacterium]